MILAGHIIFSAYGFWLPNAQNGSWSDFVRSWELLQFGRATKVETRRSVACQPFNSALRAAAKKVLMYPPVIFTGLQALAIANGFAGIVRKTGCIVHACAIMPDHVHLVIGRHHYPIQQLANLLKGGATTQLRKEGLDPFLTFSGGPQGRVPSGVKKSLPSPWSHGLWKVWLDSQDDVIRAVDYVNDNPTKAGYKKQNWKFVTRYSA
jgi:REP element-mobilizing transposase RayT